MMIRLTPCLSLLLVVACASESEDPAPPATRPQVPIAGSASGSGSGSGSMTSVVDPDDEKQPYIPAEHKAGADRWREVGIYVDGKPLGILAWAELPLALQPVWLKTKASAPKRAGTDEPGWRWAKERRYRFTDLFRALGLDLKRIKEVHVYGPRFSESIVVDGKTLRSKAAEGFMFRFGGGVSGKPIPVVPDNFGNGKSPDKISNVSVYITKKPPVLEWNVGFVLDGEIQKGVPYYGDPMRGGVRVYFDDRLGAYIKRQDLPTTGATKSADGELNWKLFDVLAAQGVPVDKIVEGWVIRNEKRHERLTRDELATMTFSAGSQAHGRILLGDKKLEAQGLALHSKPVDPATIPQPDPVDEM
jgi:hypothetical protein